MEISFRKREKHKDASDGLNNVCKVYKRQKNDVNSC